VIPVLKQNAVITHGDLDQLNIIWDKADQPILIDWESARRMNPTREIVRTCLGWSGIETENVSIKIYKNMLKTYNKSCDLFNENHLNAALFAIVGSLVFWMLYNIDIACNSIEIENTNTAIKEVNGVLKSFPRLHYLIPDLLKIKA
ncbi:MAG: phosphotransferase, partial [Ignavibacteriaceae bacterium]|nr:phosphotransferase [Ignavibacteriaceae bacterium]